MNTAKAESVKCSAKITPTRSGVRATRVVEVDFEPLMRNGLRDLSAKRKRLCVCTIVRRLHLLI